MGDRITTRSVTNPLDETFEFLWDGVPYEIPARKTVPYVDYIAVHAAKHLAYKILISLGKFDDVIKGDGRRIGSSVSKGMAEEIRAALLDRDGEHLDLEKIIKAASGAMTDKSLPVVEPPAQQNDMKAQEIIKPQSKKEEEAKNEEANDPELKEWNELQKVGFTNLKGEQRKKYKELKLIFNP